MLNIMLEMNLRCAVCVCYCCVYGMRGPYADSLCFNRNNTHPQKHFSFFISFVFLVCYFCSPPLALNLFSNKHRCSHTLTLIFKHLSFYESGEIYPLPSLFLPSATPIARLLHTFVLYFLSFSSHSPFLLCMKS